MFLQFESAVAQLTDATYCELGMRKRCVIFKYEILSPSEDLLSTHNLELVAGILGVQKDSLTMTLTPGIGWFVRTTMPEETKDFPDDYVVANIRPQ